jgi:peroxiredoxin
MVELGRLEEQHAEFDRRRTRIVAVSSDDRAEAAKTQKDFPHLVIAADQGHNLIKTVEVVSDIANPTGKDIAAPTTMLIEKAGIVRWLFRPDRYIVRLTPAELLDAVDKNLPGS